MKASADQPKRIGCKPEPFCLIVDDEPAIRGYLRVLLKDRGIQSVGAENAAEALLILKNLGDEIDLLITDIHMPGDMDGIDLAYSVRNLFASLPMILISADIEKAPPGFTFVPKPFDAEAIVQAVDQAMTGTKAGGVR